MRPQLAFDPTFTPAQFEQWKKRVRQRLRILLSMPRMRHQPQPRMVSDEPREGYRLQRWELYPEPDTVVPMMMLIPETASAKHPVPAVLCLPGSAHPNEVLAGEPEPAGMAPHRFPEHNAMARHFVARGLVALCVENPGTGSMFEPRASDWRRQCSELIWMGSSYEGLSVFHKLAALQWLRRQPMVDRDRIAACGHSLGAKPALLLGLLAPSLRAVVWNSAAYDWRVRHVVTNLVPVAPWHYVPGFVRWFDYLDLKAALAPTPLLLSEGGRNDELRKVRQAYALAGARGSLRISYCPSFRKPSQRILDHKPMPEGLHTEDYLRYLNACDDEHYFKDDVAVPWLVHRLRRREKGKGRL